MATETRSCPLSMDLLFVQSDFFVHAILSMCQGPNFVLGDHEYVICLFVLPILHVYFVPDLCSAFSQFDKPTDIVHLCCCH